MTEKKPFWLVDDAGSKALVVGVDERDRLRPLGWSESTEPAPGEWVWMEHDITGGRARFPVEAAPLWVAKGWAPSGPRGDTADGVPAEVAPAAAPLTTQPADSPTEPVDAKTTKPAVTGDKTKGS